MSQNRKFQKFKIEVIIESQNYPSLKKLNGKFNEKFLRAAFFGGQTPIECCNSMTENV